MFLDIYFKISCIPIIYFPEFFNTFAYSIRFLQGKGTGSFYNAEFLI